MDGKTRAFISLKYMFRYYYSTFGFFGLIATLYAIKRKESKKLVKLGLTISIVAIVLIFLDLWKLFI